MLEALVNELQNGNSEDLAILAAALIAFWALCRLGELLGSSSRSFDTAKLPSRAALGEMISASGSRTLHLPCTKTSQSRGEKVLITAQRSRIDPISALDNHLRATRSFDHEANLFAFTHAKSGRQKILTHEFFLKRRNDIWTRKRLPNISGHAFRIGGTSHLLRTGVAPDVVKTMGRWHSDAFLRYWRDTPTINAHHAELVADIGSAPLARLDAATGPRARPGPGHANRSGGRPQPTAGASVPTSSLARAPPLHRLLRTR
ncbi:hypothetical protein FRC07_002253 [Ceratobasidium sp. 392]|nr:hypothetical protein FRC07_002253 [Ceratobasidium sp. 392]